MQMKVELSQIRTLGEIIDDSILFFKQNYKALLKSYFVICGFFWVAGFGDDSEGSGGERAGVLLSGTAREGGVVGTRRRVSSRWDLN